ncbi:MAG: hypothetical protein ABSD39_10135 [Terriglobales bacterium]
MQDVPRQANPRAHTPAVLFPLILLASVAAIAAKDFVMPAAHPARTYPAHDEHPMEKVTVAADPYDVEYKASIFSVNYRKFGFMPIFLVITNDGDQPIALADMKAQLNTVDHSKLPALDGEDLVRRISHPSHEIDRSQFGAKAVEPHSTARGFLFFDVSGISNPLAGAHFYITGVRDPNGTELMYFEIPLEKYLSAPESKKP